MWAQFPEFLGSFYVWVDITKIPDLINYLMFWEYQDSKPPFLPAQSAGAVEYADCASALG